MAEMKTMTINGTPFTLPFAPAGYGLGTYAQILNNTNDLNNDLPTGFYRWGSLIPKNAPNLSYCVMEVIWRTDGTMLQKVHQLGNALIYQTEVHRVLVDGTGEWEYVNPPMVLGVEYRTTERYNGAPVYAKLVNFGALPSVSSKSVAHEITGKGRNVRYSLTTGDTGVFLNNYPGITQVSANSTEIAITTSEALSALNVHVGLWYTK